jgi:hypothetical protein
LCYTTYMTQKVNIPLLSDATLSEIIFGMENQYEDYVFCLNDGNVYSCESLGEYFDNPDDLDFEDLPKWTSAEGYRLMCAFAQTCPDANFKARLSDVLNSKGHGVFKRFRAVLDSLPGATDAWYKFKDKRMSAYIRTWYRKIMANHPASSPEAELAQDNSTGALMVSYDIEHLPKPDTNCLALEKEILKDHPILSRALSGFTNREAICAYQDDKLCGFLTFEVVDKTACTLIYYIEEKSRGLGLFETLFDLMNRDLERRGVNKVLFPFGGTALENFLTHRDIKSTSIYNIKEYKVGDWNRQVDSQEIAYLV